MSLHLHVNKKTSPLTQYVWAPSLKNWFFALHCSEQVSKLATITDYIQSDPWYPRKYRMKRRKVLRCLRLLLHKKNSRHLFLLFEAQIGGSRAPIFAQRWAIEWWNNYTRLDGSKAPIMVQGWEKGEWNNYTRLASLETHRNVSNLCNSKSVSSWI